MLSPIETQLVRPSEWDELLALSRKTFYDAFEHVNNPDDFEAYTDVAFRPENILLQINNPDSEFYFALIDGEKVGYIKLNTASAQTEFKDDNSLEVERIYVMATQQGKKIGNQLLNFAINKAKSEGKHYIWLGVWEHNLAAQRFYERNGFKQFSTHEFWVGNDRQIDLLMRKEL